MTRQATLTNRATVVASSLAGLGAAAAVGLGNPARGGWFPPCPLHAATGLYCPGCGSTRAIHDLLHVDLAGAFTLNPLLVLVAPVMAYVYVRWVVSAFTGRELPLPRPTQRWSAAAMVVLIVFGVARNLPVPALSWMAP
jgi:hypothetical protein